MSADFDKYLDDIQAQILRVPRDVALAVAQEIFQQVVEHTRVDSGQAAANWHFLPYESDMALPTQEILWGYKGHEPITPVGYKYSKIDNSEAIFRYQFEYMVNKVLDAPQQLRGVLIYNPIEPGFADFSPGSDTFYAQIAFEKLDISAIVENAMHTIESSYNQ